MFCNFGGIRICKGMNPTFYNRNNHIKKFFGGKIPHYPFKERIVVPKTRNYTLLEGDSYYNLCRRIFEDSNEVYWSILADINPLDYHVELLSGSNLKIPVLILAEEVERRLELGELKA